MLDPDHFGIVVGDVSDKGMPAALYKALTRSLLLAEARRERAPEAVSANVNQLLLELGNPDKLCEAVFADLFTFQGAAEPFDDMTMLVVVVD